MIETMANNNSADDDAWREDVASRVSHLNKAVDDLEKTHLGKTTQKTIKPGVRSKLIL